MPPDEVRSPRTDPPQPDEAANTRARLTGLLQAVAQRRDRTAFAELFDFFAPRVKAYLARLGAAKAESEDIAQDVMITVWRRAETFDAARASASTWIYTIARNRRIDAARRLKRPELDPNDPMFVPDPPVPADQVVETAAREDKLRAALTVLSEEQRALLVRAFYDGQSHSEIAAATGLPLGTIKSRLRLAFGRLRKVLDGEI